MAKHPRLPALFCPTAVAVHDDSNVLRQMLYVYFVFK
jgi:hypothetical protein